MLTFKVSLLLFAGIVNALLGLVVLLRNRRQTNALSFSILLFSVGGWAIGIAGFLLAVDNHSALIWAKAYYMFPLAIAFSIVYFSYTFPDRPLSVVSKIWHYIAALGFFVNTVPLIAYSHYLTTGIVEHPWGREVVLGVMAYELYSVYLLVCFAGSLYVIFQKIKKLQGVYSKQASLFFVGFSISSVFGVLFNLILPGLGNYRLIWLGPLFTAILGATMAVSIVRHKMFDVRTFIVRSIAYILSLTVLASLFGVVVFGTAKELFNLQLSFVVQVYISFGTALAALAFSRLKSFFDRVSNRLFYQDAYDTQTLLDTLNRHLVANTNIEQLLRRSAAIIGDNFKAEFCYFGINASDHLPQRVIGGGRRWVSPEDIGFMRSLTAQLKHKIIVTDELEPEHERLRTMLRRYDIAILGRLSATANHKVDGLGYLILGARRSGNPYNAKDIRALEIIVNELVLATENSLRFEQIQHFNETLQDNISEATRNLRKSNEKLQNLDATKDEFITMASHQLRTPLTAVKGYLSLVLEGDAGRLNANQRKLLEQSYTSAQRMVYLIADLLNLSRLSTGKFVIESVPTNLAEVVQAEIDQLTETAKSRDIHLEYTSPPNFPDMMLDETKIHQVVMNFIDNAIYYTPAGGTITVELHDTPTAVEYLVRDTGIGVPRNEQRHLFTKFFRAENARQARPDGTGLGLFMAKKVVAAQHGAIIFESVEGKGSVFGFRFNKRTHGVPPDPVQ